MRVDFYILDAGSAAECLHFACRLTEKAYGLDSRVHAHTSSPADAAKLDEMLWTFRQGSFVPHEVLETGMPARAPVSIGSGNDHPDQGDLLVNLSEEPPAFAEKFARIAEIVGSDEASRAAGRERFRHYRDLGIEPTTHQIGA